MRKLSEIKFMNANARDFSRALNLTMRESKFAANRITSQFGITDYVKPRDIFNIYPDTFEKNGKLIPAKKRAMADEIVTILKNKKSVDSLNMYDFVKVLVKQFRK